MAIVLGVASAVGVAIYCIHSKRRKRVMRDDEKAAAAGEIVAHSRSVSSHMQMKRLQLPHRRGGSKERKRAPIPDTERVVGPKVRPTIEIKREAFSPDGSDTAQGRNNVVRELSPDKALQNQFVFPSWKRISRMAEEGPHSQQVIPSIEGPASTMVIERFVIDSKPSLKSPASSPRNRGRKPETKDMSRSSSYRAETPEEAEVPKAKKARQWKRKR